MRRFIHVLYIQRAEGWYAQCLDVDVGAQGATREEAEQAFFATWHLQAQMDRQEGREPFSTLGRAPDEYFELADKVAKWDHRDEAADEDSAEDLTVPPAYMLAGFLPNRDSVPSSRG
jgi:hypothetical protein